MLIGVSGYIGSGKDTVASMIQFLVTKQKDLIPFTFEEFQSWEPSNRRITSNWENRKFAAKLKQMVSLLTGIPVADLEKESVKNSYLGAEWQVSRDQEDKLESTVNRNKLTTPTVRQLLQQLGTDAVRDKVHPNAWVNGLFADYSPIKYSHPPINQDNLPIIPVYPNWIISDTRFPNEAKAIKDRGGVVVRINRPEDYKVGVVIGNKGYVIPNPRHSSETSLDTWEFDYIIDNSGTIEELLKKVRTMLLHFKIIS